MKPEIQLTPLLAELSAIAGSDAVSAPAAFEMPAGWPVRIAMVRPASVAQIAPIIGAVEAAGVALITAGGGTRRHTGYPPRDDRPYVLLVTDRLNQILDYQPDDMTVTCEPGVTLAALQRRLAERRQRLLLDVPLPQFSTLGGIVSSGASGFNRPLGGSPRDLLIGMRAVVTDGVEVKGGGRVVKNVAGYDVCKLFTGAWGTVGVLTELTFRVTTLPEVDTMLAWPAPDLPAAARAGLSLHHARLAGASFLATNELDGLPTLVVGLQGNRQRVEWQAEEYARLAAAAGLNSAPRPLEPTQVTHWRDRLARLEREVQSALHITCLPTEVEGLLARLVATAPDLFLTAHCATGILDLASTDPGLMPAALLAALPTTAHRVWTRLESGPASVERWGPPRADFDLQHALKQSLDPKNTFNPGRFVGRL